MAGKPIATGSTDKRAAARMHDQTLQRGSGGELHQVAEGDTPLLTTAQGGPVADLSGQTHERWPDNRRRDDIIDGHWAHAGRKAVRACDQGVRRTRGQGDMAGLIAVQHLQPFGLTSRFVR